MPANAARATERVADQPHQEDRSLKDLVSSLGRDMGLLVRQEVQLAKAEISEKVSHVAKGSVSIGAGALIAYIGALAFAAALILIGIAIGIAAWLSALIVAVLFLLVGFSAIQGGRKAITDGPPPFERTTVRQT
jgi:Putative Actinobacterial Holin-X, holin superfamily III